MISNCGWALAKIVSQVERLREITGKLMRITRYETVEYLNGSKIVDIDRASTSDEQHTIRRAGGTGKPPRKAVPYRH